MCNERRRTVHWWTAILMGFGLAFPALAETDPPDRVGRVSFIDGQLDVTQADEDAPVTASVNYPVATGMTFATNAGARAELQLGTLTTRLDGQTKLDLVAFDDQTVGMRLDRGSVDLRIRLLFEDERVTVSTGDSQIVITEPGAYRIDADRVPSLSKNSPDDDRSSPDKTPADTAVTHVVVFAGSARVHSPHGADTVMAGEAVDVDGPRGTVRYGLADHTWLSEWAVAREQVSQPGSERYVAEDIPGAGALDAAGTWQDTDDYGAVWYPDDVPTGWAPYQSGTWTWVVPWGWTWIDSRPWGFVPFHYGRWVKIGGRWGWHPGDRHRRHTYAPALVNFGGGFKNTRQHRPDHWNPLGPGDRYHPPYRHGVQHVSYVNDGRPDDRKWHGPRRPGGHDPQRGNDNTDTAARAGTARIGTDGTMQPGRRITLPTGGQIVITDDMIRRARGGGTTGHENTDAGNTGAGNIGAGNIGTGNIGSGRTAGAVAAHPATPTPPAAPSASAPIGSAGLEPGRRITLPTGGQIVITDEMIRRARGDSMSGGSQSGPPPRGAGVPTAPALPTTPAVNPAGAAPRPVTPMTTLPGGSFTRPPVQTAPIVTQPRSIAPPAVQPQITQPQAPAVAGPTGSRFPQFPAGVAPTNMGRYPTMPRITAPTPAAPSGYPAQGMVPRVGGIGAYTGYPTTPRITAPTPAAPAPTPPPTQVNPTLLPQVPGAQGHTPGRTQ
jgi:hypothetical protein